MDECRTLGVPHPQDFFSYWNEYCLITCSEKKTLNCEVPMASTSLNLDRIRVQTARMMEIYALLQKELEENTHLSLPAEVRTQLNQAIATVEFNMRQLQAHIVTYQEENSHSHTESRELEEILDAVLKWQLEKGE